MYDNTESIAITHALVVLPDAVIAGGSVGIRDGRIAEVVEGDRLSGAYDRWVDAHGAYLMPGVIDLHNDGLEVEVNPRPETNLPVEMALANMERRLLSSGVTTEFHAIAFMDNGRNKRTVAAAATRARYVSEYIGAGAELISHQILHRLDVWSPEGLDDLFESVQRMPVRYISINDHTPGQGQYRDLSAFQERMTAWNAQRGGAAWTADEIENRRNQRMSDTDTIPFVYGRIRAEAVRGNLIIASHDDDSPEKVEALFDLGARVSEFPVTIETAQRARELGMVTVVGAPNIVRGGSSSGNQDASELFSLGLADVICADYHAPSMLPAAFRLVDEGLADLPAAIRALSFNAARVLQLSRLGAIITDYVADLILVRRAVSGVPHVERVWRNGQEVLAVRTPQLVEVTA